MTGARNRYPPLGHGFNEFRLVRSVAQSLPDLQNLLSEDLWFNIRLRPQCLKNFVLGHYPPGVLDQVSQYVEALGSYRHMIAIASQKVVAVSRRNVLNDFTDLL
jgi:hypothetical protein